jgi:hypothetical protein
MTHDELVAEARRRGREQRAAQGLPPMIVDPIIGRLASEALASAAPAAPAHELAMAGNDR